MIGKFGEPNFVLEGAEVVRAGGAVVIERAVEGMIAAAAFGNVAYIVAVAVVVQASVPCCYWRHPSLLERWRTLGLAYLKLAQTPS